VTKHVVLYLSNARFTGQSAIPYDQPPEVDSPHDCILFVSQSDAAHDFDSARGLMEKHGWLDVQFKSAGPFVAESINSQQMRVFQHHYEECLKHGDSLVWYA